MSTFVSLQWLWFLLGIASIAYAFYVRLPYVKKVLPQARTKVRRGATRREAIRDTHRRLNEETSGELVGVAAFIVGAVFLLLGIISFLLRFGG